MKVRKLILATLLAGTLWLEACAVPAWVNTVESDAEVAAPIAASLIDVIDPSLAPVVTLIETGFNALAKTLDTYKASPTATNMQAVQSAFEAVNSNVAQLESAAQIKNSTTQTTVTAVVALLSQAVTEIAALVPPATASTLQLSLPRVHGQAKGMKAKDFKKQFNALIKGDPRFAGKELK
jgi:soluble cytochrome b562